MENDAFLVRPDVVRADAIELTCSKEVWKNTTPNMTQEGINLDADSDFSATYGSFAFRAQLPVKGYGSAEFSLVSTDCPLTNCTTALNGRTTGLLLYEDSPRTVEIKVNYLNPNIPSQLLAQAVTVDRPNRTISGFHVYEVSWSRNFVAWFFDGTMVANFTNRLLLPRTRHFARIELYCLNNTMNQAEREETTLAVDKITYQRMPDDEVWKDTQQSLFPAPAVTWNETSVGPVREVYLFAYDDDVAMYFDDIRTVPGCNCNKTLDDWVFNFVGDAWRYVSQAYRLLNLTTDHRLQALLYVGKGEGCHFMSHLGRYSYVLNCGSNDSRAWDVQTDSPVKASLSQAITNLTVLVAGGVYGNPMLSIDQSGIVQGIVQYDLFRSLNEVDLARSLLSLKINKFQNAPRSYSYWLRDWYLPVYSDHGQAAVLQRVFTLLAEHFPTITDRSGMRRYSRNMANLAELVHFWSGAANASLRTVAGNAFGWSKTDEKELLQAQNDFPDIHYADDENYLMTQATVSLDLVEFATPTHSSTQFTQLNFTLLQSILIPLVIVTTVGTLLGFYCARRKRSQAKVLGANQKAPNKYISSVPLSHLNPDIIKLLDDDTKRFLLPSRNLQKIKCGMSTTEC
ncbi:hypothetical protein RvY_18525-2 [Ramazzottius varieornatus]|nr:hypothetical protein RvY_18525-2 [Ramazzottius varieornatus]